MLCHHYQIHYYLQLIKENLGQYLLSLHFQHYSLNYYLFLSDHYHPHRNISGVFGICFGKDMSARQHANTKRAKDVVKMYLSTRPRDISECQFCSKLLTKVVVYLSTHNLEVFRTSLEALHTTVSVGHWFHRLGIQIQKCFFDVGSSSYSPVVLLLSLFSPALSLVLGGRC